MRIHNSSCDPEPKVSHVNKYAYMKLRPGSRNRLLSLDPGVDKLQPVSHTQLMEPLNPAHGTMALVLLPALGGRGFSRGGSAHTVVQQGSGEKWWRQLGHSSLSPEKYY